MEGIEDSPRLRHVLVTGAVATLGALLAFAGAFVFAGAALNCALGAVLSLVARGAAALLRGSRRALYGRLARLVSPLSNVAMVYFAAGFVVFWQDIEAPELGLIDEQELEFVALAQLPSQPDTYEATFPVRLPGAYDRARIAFGSLGGEAEGDRVTKLEFEPIGDSARSIERIEPGPQHRTALLFKRVEGAVEVAVKLRAKLESDNPPELIYVVVAEEYGARDLFWHIARHFRGRY